MAVLTSTDELTGTFNRRVFVQESNQTMQHFSHTRVPFTIGILDIDHFKQLNDCYGHTPGDHVLKKMTKKSVAYCVTKTFYPVLVGRNLR